MTPSTSATVPAGRPGTPSDGATAAPRLADGVQLIGEYEDSGFRNPPSIVRRADGQVIQLPDLLYQVLVRADGRLTFAEIADEVSHAVGRGVSADNVAFLAEEKLRPMGLLALADGSSPRLAKPDPFLGLKFRIGVIPERASGLLGDCFKWLFRPGIVLLVLLGLVAGDAWLFLNHGVAQSLRQALYHPDLFLPLFGGVLLGAAFHETGHAAGCRYGGGHPGRMGCGLYLAWPAFYTDVTDAYRLGKRARLRTDLGGVYFNVVAILVTFGVYFATHVEAVLLLTLIEHFEIAHQLLPIVRLDGYYIVADLTGVPDLFARMGPILRSLAPWRRADARVTALKPWVRRAVSAWILLVVPLLGFELLVVLIHLPRIMGTAWDAGHRLAADASNRFSAGQTLSGLSSAFQIVVLAIPIIGILLMLGRFLRAMVRWTMARTEDHPALRAGAALVAVGLAVLLGLAWVPGHNYRPIQRNERGTLVQGAAAVTRLPSRRAPLYSTTHDTIPVRPGDTSTGPGNPASTSTTTSQPAGSSTTSTSARGSSGRSSGSTSTSSSTTSSSTTTSTSTSTSTSTTSTTTPSSTTTSAP